MENTYSDEEIERCTLRNPREIVFQLKTLIKRGERVSVIFQEGRQTFLTVLLDVSEKNNRLYFDIGGSNEINQAFLKAEQSTFVAIVDGIRLQFSAKAGQEVKLNGERTLAVPIPTAMLRLQRRDMFRCPLPSTKPYMCRIPRENGDESHALHDISIGGIGILTSQELRYEQLEKLENCRIDLRESGFLNVTLEIRYVTNIESRTGKPLWHMGCRFVDLTPASEVLIQRFMARIEAERRALSAD
ncbi:flagellar brake protein [Propionivibrio limicola]|uniref:flagellar brake protein n=1 Tax=Propionivibrio limicola TaxID=167645 RepID=UPI00129099EB|nr:flagellar brake protein [Propionivibrio limicola]